MIYVGIDIAKLNHFASAISADGVVLMEPFKFTNDGDGFQLLVSHLDQLLYQDDQLIIGLESTAHYGDNLVRYLVAEGFNVCVLNPIKTSVMRKDNIRKTKTDKVDLIDLKTLGRFRQKTIKQRTRLKIQLTSYVDQVLMVDLGCSFTMKYISCCFRNVCNRIQSITSASFASL